MKRNERIEKRLEKFGTVAQLIIQKRVSKINLKKYFKTRLTIINCELIFKRIPEATLYL